MTMHARTLAPAAQTGYIYATAGRTRVMTRRTRIRQPSNPAGLSYGLTKITVAMIGLVFVDSFNLNLLADQPLAAKTQHGARTAFRATAVGSTACRASSPRTPDGGSSPSLQRRTASGEALAQQQRQPHRRCVTTTAGTRSATPELATSTLAARARSKGTRSSNNPSTLAGNVDSAPGKAGGKDGRHRRERRTEERVRLSAGLGHAPMSRARAVSAFAAAGAAALVVGRGGLANAATEV